MGIYAKSGTRDTCAEWPPLVYSLDSLTLVASCRLLAPDGTQVQLTGDGQQPPITAGSSWVGQIVLERVPIPHPPVEPSAGPDPRPKTLPATGVAR